MEDSLLQISLALVSDGGRHVVEADNVSDPAVLDGEHLIAESRSATLAGVVGARHAHAHQEPITQDSYVEHASSNAALPAFLIPGHDLFTVLASWVVGTRCAPGHVRVQQVGKGRHVVGGKSPSNLSGYFIHRPGHDTSYVGNPPTQPTAHLAMLRATGVASYEPATKAPTPERATIVSDNVTGCPPLSGVPWHRAVHAPESASNQ